MCVCRFRLKSLPRKKQEQNLVKLKLKGLEKKAAADRQTDQVKVTTVDQILETA